MAIATPYRSAPSSGSVAAVTAVGFGTAAIRGRTIEAGNVQPPTRTPMPAKPRSRHRTRWYVMPHRLPPNAPDGKSEPMRWAAGQVPAMSAQLLPKRRRCRLPRRGPNDEAVEVRAGTASCSKSAGQADHCRLGARHSARARSSLCERGRGGSCSWAPATPAEHGPRDASESAAPRPRTSPTEEGRDAPHEVLGGGRDRSLRV